MQEKFFKAPRQRPRKPWVLAAAILLVTAPAASAQHVARMVVSTLPGFTPSSMEPTDGQAHAFMDFANSQIVVVLPSVGPDGTHNTLRFDVPNQVDPTVSWSVSESAPGRFLYTYSISDAPQSRQRTGRVSFLAPEHDATLVRSDSAPWAFAMEQTSVPDRSGTVSMAAMRRISWTDPNISPAKVAALQLSVASQYLPGFCAIELEGQVPHSVTPQALASLPASVASQVQMAAAPGVGAVRRTAVCPLYPTDTQKSVIAGNYNFGLQVLVHHGDLDGNSAYVQQLSSYLRNFLASGSAGPLAVPAFAPQSAAEKQIQQATTIALR